MTDEVLIYDEWPEVIDEEMPEVEANLNVVPTLEEAVSDYQYGCEEAFDYVFRYYKSKLEYNVNRYHDEDVMQELSMVLHRCAMRYRSGGSSLFNTFFWTCAQNHLGMLTSRKRSSKQLADTEAISLSLTIDDDSVTELADTIVDTSAGESFEDTSLRVTLERTVYPYVDQLDRSIIRLLAGGFTVYGISQHMNISIAKVNERMRSLINNRVTRDAFVKMRRAMVDTGR